MDESEPLREKLSRAVLETTAQRSQDRWGPVGDRVLDLWKRFCALSFIEKAIITGCLAIVLIMPPVAVTALSGGGGDDSPALVARSTRTATARPAKSTPTPTALLVLGGPSPTPEGRPPPPAAIREDCDEIRGTPYQSPAEREWFLENCPPEDDEQVSGPSKPPTPRPSQGQPPPPPPPPPTNPPPPPTGFSSGDAIALAVQWMTNDAPASYVVDQGSCSAVWLSPKWVVSCSATLEGCQTAVCSETLTVCVFADTRRVVPTDQC